MKAKDLKLAAIPATAPGVIELIMSYHWPGNVRNLQNIIERALIFNPKGPIAFENLGLDINRKVERTAAAPSRSYNLGELIMQHINAVMEITGGKVNGSGGAAEIMGVNPSTLRNKMKKLGISYGRTA